MPRLLLVDDNPSIHKIAETLLAATDVELVCASSGAEALTLIEQNGPFDVALLDTSMLGMDGWALLERIRGMEATARIPVAMMAGVLDAVDPEKLRLAPIQGFLKKPVELRDLGERVKRLMETPVLAPVPETQAAPEASPFNTQPGFQLADHPELLQKIDDLSMDDVLLLGPQDLLREPSTRPEPPPPVAQVGRFQTDTGPLDLEELDLEVLRELTPEAQAPAPEPEETDPEDFTILDTFPPLEIQQVEVQQVELPPEEISTLEEVPGVPEFSSTDAFLGALEMDEENTVTTGELPDLGPEPGRPETIAAAPMAMDSEVFDWSEDSDSLLELPAETGANPAPEPTLAAEPAPDPEPATAMFHAETPTAQWDDLAEFDPEPAAQAPTAALPAIEDLPEPEAPEPIPEPVPALIPEPVPAPIPAPVLHHPVPTEDPLAAILADPVLMDRLTRAVVAKLGDQALKEIAWEIMPELADRLHRN